MDLVVTLAVEIVIQQTNGEGQLLMLSNCVLRAFCMSALELGIFLVKLNLPRFEKGMLGHILYV